MTAAPHSHYFQKKKKLDVDAQYLGMTSRRVLLFQSAHTWRRLGHMHNEFDDEIVDWKLRFTEAHLCRRSFNAVTAARPTAGKMTIAILIQYKKQCYQLVKTINSTSFELLNKLQNTANTGTVPYLHMSALKRGFFRMEHQTNTEWERNHSSAFVRDVFDTLFVFWWGYVGENCSPVYRLAAQGASHIGQRNKVSSGGTGRVLYW